MENSRKQFLDTNWRSTVVESAKEYERLRAAHRDKLAAALSAGIRGQKMARNDIKMQASIIRDAAREAEKVLVQAIESSPEDIIVGYMKINNILYAVGTSNRIERIDLSVIPDLTSAEPNHAGQNSRTTSVSQTSD